MTEETIINGVDVSGCEYAEKSIPIDCSIDNCFCYENKNCYYKQLKRLEQENEKLEKKLEQIKNAILYCGEADFCNICKLADKCNGYVEEVILKIIEGAEDD